MKSRKAVRYANPLLHVVRKRTTVLATQLIGEESLDSLTSLYLNVVEPTAFGDEDSFSLSSYDMNLGVLTFHPTEKPLEMTIGDWLIFDGDTLSVVSNATFRMDYRITVRHNKKEKNVRSKKDKFQAARRDSEYSSWQF